MLKVTYASAICLKITGGKHEYSIYKKGNRYLNFNICPTGIFQNMHTSRDITEIIMFFAGVRLWLKTLGDHRTSGC